MAQVMDIENIHMNDSRRAGVTATLREHRDAILNDQKTVVFDSDEVTRPGLQVQCGRVFGTGVVSIAKQSDGRLAVYKRAGHEN